MFDEILNQIKEYKNIIIARHVGVDPDAMSSQVALRDIIKLNFPDKNVLAVGNGSQKFTYIGKLDKQEAFDDATLLIVVDIPDKGRVDVQNIDDFEYKIKIDHHPFIEEFCDLEYIDDQASSAAEIIAQFAYDQNLKIDESIARNLFIGIVSDTNRFMFANSKESTFKIAGKLIKDYNIDITKVYEDVYLRPMREIRLEGFISQNMTLTENGLGYMRIKTEDLTKVGADVASAGNLINNYNYINELLVWVIITEDPKNEMLKVNIRSRGPIINDIAENYHGGGHNLASGARIYKEEEVEKLLKELDERVKEYNNKED